MRLDNTTALITGASRGLGRALSTALALRGARVAMVARGKDELNQAAHEITQQGGTVYPLCVDIADKDQTYALAGAAAALLGPIDLLIHNASTLGPTPMPLLLDTDCEDLENVLATNLIGPFRLSKAIAGSMALRQTGTIVQISSDAAVSAYAGWGAYGVSKAAADHLSKSLAVELEAHGVRVLCIDPGEMDTQMHAQAVPDADRSTLRAPMQVAEQILALLAAPTKSGTRWVVSAVADGAEVQR